MKQDGTNQPKHTKKKRGEHLQPFQWKPGQCGNPEGKNRVRGLGIKALLKSILEEAMPGDDLTTVGDKLLEAAINRAAKGDAHFFATLMKHADDVPVHHEVNQSLRVIREVSGLDEAAILGESKDG